MKGPLRSPVSQAGATAVEFALGLIIFLSFFLAVLDFSRMLWTWNAAGEATRWGARLAAVCGKDSPVVLERMRVLLPQLQAGQVVVDWYDRQGLNNACTGSGDTACRGLQLRLRGMSYSWMSPVGGAAGPWVAMPAFSTYLPVESMGRDPGSASACSASAL
jgi:hypothetical protein